MDKRAPFQRKKMEQAQSLVEMAISLIVLLFLLLGAVEFSLALFQFVTIRDAAQEGALYGSINPADEGGIKQRALAAASDVLSGLDESNVDVNWSGPQCEGTTGGVPNTIEVVVVFEHPIVFPFVGPMIGTDKIKLTGRVINTILQPHC